MKIKFNSLSLSLIVVMSLAKSNMLSAEGIAQTLRNNSEATENYFELGVGAKVGLGPSKDSEDDEFSNLFITAYGNYNWGGFFVESYGTVNETLLGYNVYNSDDWSFDIIYDYQRDSRNRGVDEVNNDGFSGLESQKGTGLIGTRVTRYIDNNIIQFSLKHDIGDTHSGTTASASLGRRWQVKNWNLYGLMGVGYADSKAANYLYGISVDEASNGRYDQYAPGSTLSFATELGATYPINENWVFRSTARYTALSDEIIDSPLFINKRSDVFSLSTSISYVF